ncbi:hypothetical protein ABIC83_002734 [Roseateles asaccharophilus]|uniref:HAD domain-containing protein n=1 Tax=Roseateles asaccharophilus TaxID=582607 RepID=UPI0038324000
MDLTAEPAEAVTAKDLRFLSVDLDGVLHGADAHFAVEDIKVPLQALRAAGLFVHLELLDEILAPHPEVKLLVHSSWRLTHNDDELRELLGPLGDRFIGATIRELDRQLSIFEFAVTRQLKPEQYRVLDDQVELLEELGDAVIACDPELGLSAPAARQALEAWLNS